MLLPSEQYCEFIWGQQSIHLSVSGLPRTAKAPLPTLLVPGCGCWDWGLGHSSFPAGKGEDPSQEAAGTTSPTPSSTAGQQAQISSHPCTSTISLPLFPMQKASLTLSCSCPSSLIQQYLILQVVLSSLGLIQVKLFCMCDLLTP